MEFTEDSTAKQLMKYAEELAVQKLINFAKTKPSLTWDEVIEYLGQDFVNQDEKMEPVIELLKEINREPQETDIIGADDSQEDELVDDEDEDDDESEDICVDGDDESDD